MKSKAAGLRLQYRTMMCELHGQLKYVSSALVATTLRSLRLGRMRWVTKLSSSPFSQVPSGAGQSFGSLPVAVDCDTKTNSYQASEKVCAVAMLSSRKEVLMF